MELSSAVVHVHRHRGGIWHARVVLDDGTVGYGTGPDEGVAVREALRDALPALEEIAVAGRAAWDPRLAPIAWRRDEPIQ